MASLMIICTARTQDYELIGSIGFKLYIYLYILVGMTASHSLSRGAEEEEENNSIG